MYKKKDKNNDLRSYLIVKCLYINDFFYNVQPCLFINNKNQTLYCIELHKNKKHSYYYEYMGSDQSSISAVFL